MIKVLMYRKDYFPSLVWNSWIKDCEIIHADPEYIELTMNLSQFDTLSKTIDIARI